MSPAERYPILYKRAHSFIEAQPEAKHVVAVLLKQAVQHALLRCLFLGDAIAVDAEVQDILNRTQRSLSPAQRILLNCLPEHGAVVPNWDLDFVTITPTHSGACIELPVVTGSFIFRVTHCKSAYYLVELDRANVQLDNGTFVPVHMQNALNFLFDAENLTIATE